MNRRNKLYAVLLTAAMVTGTLTGCGNAGEAASMEEGKAAGTSQAGENTAVADDAVQIVLADGSVTVDGSQAGSNETASVYLSNDIIYYEDRETYESGNPYGEGSETERHSADTAAAHTVVNITEAGTYRISGSLEKGQIRVDLGEEAETDPEAVVTLILDNVEIQCEVAPAIVFMNVYECDNEWSAEAAGSEVNTEAAGANLVIADGSTNEVTGSHVARIFEDVAEEKKLWKQDGAVYSYMSMNVSGEKDGTGVLNITADNEGLDTELHLTINSGNINIRSQNDGINTNEDGVSVTTINGGNLHIIAGLGEEGDGIDSNGWLVINGGTVIASANPAADAGLDSDMGSYVNGGIVVALGSTMDWAESDSEQVTMNLQFAGYRDSDSAIVVTDEDGNYVFAYDPSMDEVVGENTRKYMGAIISCPDFAIEESYHVYIGGTVAGTETAGVYDVASISGYEGGVQQSYTGTDVSMGPGGFGGQGFGGGERPDGNGQGFGGGERPDGNSQGFGGGEQPDGNGQGFGGGQRPDGVQKPDGDQKAGDGQASAGDGQRPELPSGEQPTGGMPSGEQPTGEVPEGFKPGEGQPEMPSGEMPSGEIPSGKLPTGEMPEGFTPGEGQPDMMQGGTMPTGEANAVFYMQDKVNCFSGVADME